MGIEDAETHRLDACTVSMSSHEVVAGADLRLSATVSCSQGCDLSEQTLLIRDQDGALVGTYKLADLDGVTSGSESEVRAPTAAGVYAWSALIPVQKVDGVLHHEAVAPFSFTVKPHKTSVAVWAIPSAISSRDSFRIVVGIKCSAGCQLAGRDFEIYDHAGARVATAIAGSDAWPGTSALYFSNVELEAPAVEGYFRWEARLAASELGIPHEGSSHTFGVRITRPPECGVTVEALDQDDRTPIRGALVKLHPFSAFTDEHGRATVRVARGVYKLHVSGLKYAPFQASLEVTGDMATQAMLAWEPDMDEYDLAAVPEVRERTRLQKAEQEKQQLRAQQEQA